jgi:hypothetical protein
VTAPALTAPGVQSLLALSTAVTVAEAALALSGPLMAVAVTALGRSQLVPSNVARAVPPDARMTLLVSPAASPAMPAPTTVFPDPVVTPRPVLSPTATLPVPVVRFSMDFDPTATFGPPVAASSAS